MSLQELPSGDFIDPDYNHVGGICVECRRSSDEVFWGISIITEKCIYFVPCKDEMEAKAIRGSIAVKLGFVPPNDIKTPKDAVRQ